MSLLLVLPFRLRRRPEGWYSRGWGYCLSLLALLLAGAVIAVTLRSFLIQPFSIPSSSMEPTLQPGDHIFANKRAYGVGPYSLPFGPWPLELGRRMPRRGDIVIFRHPDRPGQDYVKRLIGLPGDMIAMVGGGVVLNRTPLLLQEEILAEESEPGGSGRIFRETLPDGRSYRIRDIVEGAFGDDAGPFVVPAGQFFALGDNRDNSDDSRFSMGSVPLDNLIGRADVIFWNSEGAPFRERRALAP